MKLNLVTLSTPLALLTPVTALAHPGEHSAHDLGGMLAHIAGSPFHVVMLVSVPVLALLVWRLFARRSSQPARSRTPWGRDLPRR